MRKIIADVEINRQRRAQSNNVRNRKILKRRKNIVTAICRINQAANQNNVPKADRRKHKPHVSTVVCPVTFSLIDNAEEVIGIITSLQQCWHKRRSVFVDMTKVTQITHDAIVVLLSIMTMFKKSNIGYNGSFPTSATCRAKLQQSGFFESLFDQKNIKYNGVDSHNVYFRSNGNMAHGVLAKKVVKISSRNVWKEERRCQGVYRILIELMQNTHDHASSTKKGDENWWLSVNYDSHNNKVCFSFFDYGVGVFNSLSGKSQSSIFYDATRRLKEFFGEANTNADLLKLIMDGEMHKTCTGKYYRGKGLPGIKTTLDRKQINNLIIITNDALGVVDQNKYVSLRNKLSGTFLYWELGNDNNSCY